MKLALAACLAGWLSSGCNAHSCTEIGCQPSATIELATPLTQAGEYRFEVQADGAALSCTAFVPLRRDGTEPLCESFGIQREELTTRTGDGISGTAGDAIAGVSVPGQPATILLSITRDGTTVMNAEVRPRYAGVEINGEGCGECPMASDTIGG